MIVIYQKSDQPLVVDWCGGPGMIVLVYPTILPDIARALAERIRCLGAIEVRPDGSWRMEFGATQKPVQAQQVAVPMLIPQQGAFNA